MQIIHSKNLFIQKKKNPKLFIQRFHTFKKIQNNSFKKFIDSRKSKIIHSNKIFVQVKNGLSPRARVISITYPGSSEISVDGISLGKIKWESFATIIISHWQFQLRTFGNVPLRAPNALYLYPEVVTHEASPSTYLIGVCTEQTNKIALKALLVCSQMVNKHSHHITNISIHRKQDKIKYSKYSTFMLLAP